MVTTHEMLEEIGTCSASGSLVQIGTDAGAYTDLKTATSEELLEAVIWFLRQSASPPVEVEVAISYLREGFALAGPGGWVHVAPMWLRESRKEKDEPLAT